MKIGLAADHGGFAKKEMIKKYLLRKKYEVIDYGASKVMPTDDFPDYASKLANGLINKEVEYGISFCTTGIGMSISLNKFTFVRAAKISTKKEAIMARKHNDANALSISSKQPNYLVKDMVDAFLKTDFENHPRLVRRNEKIESVGVNNEY